MSAAEFRSAAFFTPLKMNNPKFHKPTIHSMKRRSLSHDYSYKGYYHITITTTKTLCQPLGQMAGQLEKPDGDPDAPHVALSPIGKWWKKNSRKAYTSSIQCWKFRIMSSCPSICISCLSLTAMLYQRMANLLIWGMS